MSNSNNLNNSNSRYVIYKILFDFLKSKEKITILYDKYLTNINSKDFFFIKYTTKGILKNYLYLVEIIKYESSKNN